MLEAWWEAFHRDGPSLERPSSLIHGEFWSEK
jgi:hypothetical protein